MIQNPDLAAQVPLFKLFDFTFPLPVGNSLHPGRDIDLSHILFADMRKYKRITKYVRDGLKFTYILAEKYENNHINNMTNLLMFQTYLRTTKVLDKTHVKMLLVSLGNLLNFSVIGFKV